MSVFFILISCAGYSARYDSTEKLFFAGKKKGGEELTVIGVRDKNAERGSADILSLLLPALRIHGEAFYSDNENIIIKIDSISVIANWPNGWTSGEWEASGTVVLEGGAGDSFRCRVTEPIMLWDIKKGETRYYDTYYRKDDGLQKVRNRMERIKEVCRFLQDRNEFPSMFGDIKKETAYGKSMNDLLLPFLFPETVDFKKTAAEWSTDSAVEYSSGAEMRWISDYTRAVFPEHLQKLRDSGTIWRDYEEAPELFMSVYNLQYYLQHILDSSDFIEK